MVKKDWDGVVHNVCMVHKDSICMYAWVNDDGML